MNTRVSVVMLMAFVAVAVASNWEVCSGGQGSYQQESDYPLPQRPGPGAYMQTGSYTFAIQKSLSGNGGPWTVHGLWADSQSARRGVRGYNNDPSCCTQYEGSTTAKIGAISSFLQNHQNLQSEMSTYWPDDNTQYPAGWLWAHEWEKHGTCCLSYSGARYTDPVDYFRQSLKQLAQHQHRCEAPLKQCKCSVDRSLDVLSCQMSLDLNFNFVGGNMMKANATRRA